MTERPSTNGRPLPREGRRNRPRFVLLGAVLLLALAGAVMLLLAFFRDPLPPLELADLEAAEARWRAEGPADYDLDLQLGGARPGSVHVEVRGGEVTAMTRDGQTPDQRRTWDVWSVEGQFDTLFRELELADAPAREMQVDAATRLVLRAEFDPRFGYPQRYRRIVLGQGPEVYWEVTRFRALPDGEASD